mgnify:CR=1 FL=1
MIFLETTYHLSSYNVWVKKTETIHNSVISHSSKSILLIMLSFFHIVPAMGESFWQKDGLITCILIVLWLITLLWIVSVFLTQTLGSFKKDHHKLRLLSCLVYLLLHWWTTCYILNVEKTMHNFVWSWAGIILLKSWYIVRLCSWPQLELCSEFSSLSIP